VCLTPAKSKSCLFDGQDETLNGREDFSASSFAEQILGFEGIEGQNGGSLDDASRSSVAAHDDAHDSLDYTISSTN
jgi:hypothetical protein